MKKLLLLLFLTILLQENKAQINFEWVFISDSVGFTKDVLYNKTKVFIAENYKTTKNIIQEDNKETGLVIIKGITNVKTHFALKDVNYYFRHQINFFIKDNKYKVIIKNIECELVTCHGTIWPNISLIEYPKNNGMWITGISEKRYNIILVELKRNIQLELDNYIKTINIIETNW